MSSKVTIKMDSNWEKNLQKQIMNSPQFKQIQKDANDKAQAVVRDVDRRMKGGEVDAIHAELIKQIRALGAKPNVENLREYAESIAKGTLK